MERNIQPEELLAMNRKDVRDLIPQLGRIVWYMSGGGQWKKMELVGVNIHRGTVTIMAPGESTDEIEVSPLREDNFHIIKIKEWEA